MTSNRVLEKIRDFKHKSFGDTALCADLNGTTFQVILMTETCADDPALMDLLGRWRKENEAWFCSQFPVSRERTMRWFRVKCIEVPDRLLFLVKTDAGYIGHIGLFRFDIEKGFCEIDNIVRGEKGYPGLMEEAIRRMMVWGQQHLALKFYRLKCFSDNSRALKLYERLGFREISRIPLKQEPGPDGPEWVEGIPASIHEASRFYTIMEYKPW